MKEIKRFELETDVTEIECDVIDAAVTVKESEDDKMRVLFPDAKNVFVACGEETLFISQKKRGLFLGRQAVCIEIPAHTVPSLKIGARTLTLDMAGGIFGVLYAKGESGEVDLAGCAFESAEITGGDLNVKITGCTVKNAAYLNIEKGNVLCEESFAKRCEFRVGAGNLGLVDFKCKDCVAETGKGNVNARICGDERDFNCSVYAKGGALDRAETSNPEATCSLKAYSKEGNVTLEFIEPQAVAPDKEPAPLKEN